MFSGEINDRKERKKVENISKQIFVSSKRRGRYRSGYTYLPSQRAASFVGPVGQTEKSKPSGNTHKIPEKTNCRRDRDF